MQFSAKFLLLQNEAFLARGCLSAGLTALRNATFPDKATFYSGFFNTAIALERVMKLIVVTDHMLQNAYLVPSKAQLKAYGHNLDTLYTSCVSTGNRLGVSGVTVPAPGSLEREILEFFSEFATHARYYNLDALSSVPTTYDDPLVRWGNVLLEVLAKDVPRHKVNTVQAQARAIGHLIADVTHAIQFGMDGHLLTLDEVLSTPAIHSLATPHAMVRLFRILSPLLKVVTEAGNQGFYGSPQDTGPHVPVFSEFFIHFGGTDAEIRRKKRWP